MPRKLFKYLCFVILSMFLLAGLKAIISRPFTTPPSPTAVMAVKDMVESLITDNLVVVFSKSFCPFCIKAKKLLESLNIAFKPVELDIVEDGPAIQSYLATKSGQRTVPNIFIKQQHVGGCDDLHELHKKGKLMEMVKQ